ncbi:GGDEF domain-containing protein [Uliginosibacterium sp. H1]|uniref:GGDEF domain-containing protein n=1 Tax=Uliginosibacterium sp. H1 TaxID=3114757 RepID=UPI002E18DB5B|nr:GGDEF domain-containing protein [Uliginosibacterium sp. H1]
MNPQVRLAPHLHTDMARRLRPPATPNMANPGALDAGSAGMLLDALRRLALNQRDVGAAILPALQDLVARLDPQAMPTLAQRAHAAEEEARALRQALGNLAHGVRRDELTGLLNRKGLVDAFDAESARAARDDGMLCVALLDLDDFKRLNDHHGHLAGDHALQHFATLARDHLRPQDAMGRFGGEEFIVLLPGASPAEAVTIIERLQAALATRAPHWQARDIPLSFSAGVIRVQAHESWHQAITRADGAMYVAKRAGKARCLAA